MLRTQRPLKVAKYASENNVRDLLHLLKYPSVFSMRVEINAAELYFTNATKGLPIEVPKYSLVGFPRFNLNGLLIPEFDGEYILSNLVVTYSQELSQPTIVSFVEDYSNIYLLGKAPITLNPRYGLL